MGLPARQEDPRAAALRAELARRALPRRWELSYRHLAWFVRSAWHLVEPGVDLRWNWHLDVICEALERVTRGECKRLVICIPPGHMKSLLVSVFWPAWEWLHLPSRRKLFLSNDDVLTVRDSRRTREIITSEWYTGLQSYLHQTRGIEPWTIAKDQNQKVNFANSAAGFRQCRSVWGKITGKRADDIISDDLLDAKEAILGSVEQVQKRIDDLKVIWEQVLPTRENPASDPRWVLIMQRLHPEDPASLAIAEGWESIILPARYDPDLPAEFGSTALDQRTRPGELLFPALYPEEKLAALEKKLGARQTAGQLQQRPTAAEGLIFKAGWFKQHYPGDPKTLFSRGVITEIAISVDCTFKGGKGSDYVVMQAWGRKGARRYLLDQRRGRWSFPETVKQLRGFCADWPKARLKLIEAKANGQAIIDTLAGEVPGLVAYVPKESKEARAQVSALAYEAGQVYLPAPAYAPWLDGFIAEHLAFPAGSHDDQIDPESQLFIRWQGADLSGWATTPENDDSTPDTADLMTEAW